MFGIILFWIHYLLALILLYHLLKCVYIKGKYEKNTWNGITYEKTPEDKRLKFPLWVIILLLIAFFVPILNLCVYIAYLTALLAHSDGSMYNKYYCKSFLTKEY